MADAAGKEKVTIRALLQSVKYGLSPEQLWKDYIKMIGEECPYEKYGHNSFVDFLKAMPDVARFSTVRGQTVVVPVATAETKHIAKMVANQKCTAGSNVRNIRGNPPADAAKTVPLDLQAKVKRLILPYPNGIPLHLLPTLFAKRYGYNIIPEKFGYMSTEEFVCCGLQMDITMDKTENIRVVQLQETPPTSLSLAGFRPTVGRGRPHRGGAQGGRGGSSQGSWDRQPQGGWDRQPQGGWDRQPQGGWDRQPQGGWDRQPQREWDRQPQGGWDRQPQGGSGRQPQGGWDRQPQGGGHRQPQGGWDRQPQGGGHRQPQGGWDRQSQEAEMFPKARPVQGSTASHEEQLVNKFNKKLSLNDIDRSPIGPPKPLPQQKNSKSGDPPATSPKPVPRTFKGVLWRMLKQYPRGIPLPNFQEYYRRYAHEDLPVLGLGFRSIEQFVAAVPDVLVQHREENGRVMLFAAPSSPTADQPLQPPIAEDGPKDGEEEAPLPLSSFQKGAWPTKESVNVMVTHVVDPGHFYVQIIGQNSLEPLHTLQEDMTMFYSNSASSQHYYLSNVKIGQVCVAVFPEDNCWYRAEIISVPDENRVSVRYVDYGNTATVPRLAVRRAKAHYFSLPVQALECTCAKIKPEGSQFWSAAATEYFRTMTEGKVIIAFVKKGQSQSGRLPLSLCDTSTEDDIFLSKELVQQGLAELDTPQITKTQHQASATPPAPPQSTWPPLPSTSVSAVPSASQVPPPLPSAQVPYYMVHPQLWSAYMNHISMLQQRQGVGLGAGPYLGLGGQVHQPSGLETYPALTPTSDCMGVGMGLPGNQANQSGNVWLPSDDTELDTTSSARLSPEVKAAEEAVGTLVNERRKIIQSMNALSDQSGTLSSTIDKLSALEAQIRVAENKLQQLKARGTGQGPESTVNARPSQLDIRSQPPWQPATSLGIGRGTPVSPQVAAAPGGLVESWPISTPMWQPQPPAVPRASQPPPAAPRATQPLPPSQLTSSADSESITRDFLTESQASLSSPVSLPSQEVGSSWNKMEAPCPTSESQKSANIGIGRGSSIRALCAQAGLDWI